MKGFRAKGFGVLALAVAFSLVWSSAFIAGKLAVADFDPATALVLRFALSGALLAPFALTDRRPRLIGLGLALGALNNSAYLGLAFTALTLVRPAVVVAIVSAAPFFTAAFAGLLRIEPVRPRQIVGALIGFAGVIVVIGVDFSGANVTGVCVAFLGTLSFSAATLVFRARGGGLSATALNFWQSLAGALLLAPFSGGFAREIAAAHAPAFGALAYLAIVATIGGMAMWFALIRLAGAAGASSAHLMNPAFGALLAALVLGTPLRAADFVGAAIIAAGLALTLRPAPVQERLRPSKA